MITYCPHCGRPVTREEWLVKTALGWTPTVCTTGDGPLALQGSEIVRNHRFWYCTVQDGRRRGFLMGPFLNYEEAEYWLPSAKRKAHNASDRAAWYAYGLASSEEEIKTVFGRAELEDNR